MSNATEISEIMANAKKQIEEKKAMLGLKTDEDTRTANIAALKAKIAAKSASLRVPMYDSSILQDQISQRDSLEDREKSLNLIIDAEGRTIDKRTGEVVQLQSRVPTLKANLKAIKRDFKTAMGTAEKTVDQNSTGNGPAGIKQLKVEETPEVPTSSENQSDVFFDNRLRIKTAERNKRSLVFNEKGKYQDIANKLRAKAKLTLLQNEIQTISRKTGISTDSRMALIQPKRLTVKETVPVIEWWDFAVLNETNYDCIDKLNRQKLAEKMRITCLIEHPVQMKHPTFTEKKVVPTVMLTKKERKKIRRQNRIEALKEEQEKIRLGLLPPPEPKVKISNLMRVLGTEAVQDPTKVEEYVRNQMAKRQKMHEDANAARKLTDTERSAKKKRKIMENTSLGVHVGVYRIKDLSDPSVKFKLETNCNQLHMTGIVLLCRTLNVVVVEGGPKQQKKFKRLMLNRIKWGEIEKKKSQIEREESEGIVQEKNSCALVWEGMIKSRTFGTIIFKMCPTASFARDYFKKMGCEQYWDAAQSDVILQMADN